MKKKKYTIKIQKSDNPKGEILTIKKKNKKLNFLII
jgi:hypothetical protein